MARQGRPSEVVVERLWRRRRRRRRVLGLGEAKALRVSCAAMQPAVAGGGQAWRRRDGGQSRQSRSRIGGKCDNVTCGDFGGVPSTFLTLCRQNPSIRGEESVFMAIEMLNVF